MFRLVVVRSKLPHSSVAVTVTVALHVPTVLAVFTGLPVQLSLAVVAAIAAASAAATVGKPEAHEPDVTSGLVPASRLLLEIRATLQPSSGAVTATVPAYGATD